MMTRLRRLHFHPFGRRHDNPRLSVDRVRLSEFVRVHPFRHVPLFERALGSLAGQNRGFSGYLAFLRSSCRASTLK